MKSLESQSTLFLLDCTWMVRANGSKKRNIGTTTFRKKEILKLENLH